MIVERSLDSFSNVEATAASATSRKPPVSPARSMLTMISGISRCLASASENALPVSISRATSCRTPCSFGFSVWSATTVTARSRARPDAVIVASWRVATARSWTLIRLARKPRSISLFRPVPACFSAMWIGDRPIAATRLTPAASFRATRTT